MNISSFILINKQNTLPLSTAKQTRTCHNHHLSLAEHYLVSDQRVFMLIL